MLNNKKLIKGFKYSGEFLNSSNLDDLLDSQEFSDFNELIKWLDDNSGDKISELSDSMVDIYYYDLRQWSLNNYDYIEEAVKEFGYDSKNFDFHNIIQLGQYYAYNNEFYEMISQFKQYIENTYKIGGTDATGRQIKVDRR